MTHQIVIPLHPKGGKFGNDSEAVYALRSIERHFKGDFRVAVVSRKPPAWLDGAEHVPDGGKGLKTALRVAADRFPDGFFWWYDDCVLLRDQTPEELSTTTACHRWTSAKTSWAKNLERIRQRAVREDIVPWDYSRPHGPYWFNKEMIDEAFADWPGMKAKFPFESWILSKCDWPRRFGGYKQYYGPFRAPPGEGHFLLNYNDRGNTPELRAWLGERFPEPGRFERRQQLQPASKNTGRNAISFSLFGDHPLYVGGAYENITLAREHYPGWDVVVHVERAHPSIPRLAGMGAVVVEHDPEPGLAGTLWRFASCADTTYDRVVCRDTDSRLNPRERAAVDEWISEDTLLHTMWDHERPRRRNISAGSFGMKTDPEVSSLLADWKPTGEYGDDEDFLNTVLWPRLRHSATRHLRGALPGGGKPFPPHAPFEGRIGSKVNPSPPAPGGVVVYRIGKPRPGEIGIAPVRGAGKSPGTCAAHINAAVEALRRGVYPCLILEDDAEWFADLVPLPDMGDEPWLWVGLSKYHVVGGKGKWTEDVLPSDENGTVDMGSMCANHGVVHFSPEGPHRIILAATEALARRTPVDVAMAKFNWPRRALASPWVYQRGMNEKATRFGMGDRPHPESPLVKQIPLV